MKDKNYNTTTKEVFSYFFRQAFSIWKFFWLTLFSIWILTILQLTIPIYFKEIVDIASSDLSKQDAYVEMISVFWYFVSTIILIFVFWRLLDFVLSYSHVKIDYNITKENFTILHKHSYDFFVNYMGWSLMRKVARLTHSMQRLLDVFLFNITRILISFIFILVVISLQNIYLWIIFASWVLSFVFLSLFLNKYRVPYEKAAANENSKAFWIFSDTITNSFNVKLFWNFKKEFSNFMDVIESWRNKELKSIYVYMIVFASISLVLTVWEIFLLYFAINLWFDWAISIWVFVLLVTYQIIITDQMFSLSFIIWRIYTNIWNSLDMMDILKKPYWVNDLENAKEISISEWSIELSKVNFSYKNQDKVFNNLNLSIKPWEKIWIVGQSGSWKSTFMKLLFRFYDLDWGKILIDWQDISKVKQDSLRSKISMVPQEPILFHRSLKENISYGKEDASDEEVITASKLAHCHEFISKLPEWYDSLVGERGVKLSGGEKQRVAIARAILADNKILVLDEATSSLDSESEQYIQEALDKIMEWRTVIAIAHRLSTIMKMDRILVFDNWKIVQEWTHQELLEKWGYYKKLWDIQSGDFH